MGTGMPTDCHFRCKRSVLVDRQEHEESQILICPLPDCNYSWCKACQQSITTASDTPHSCDGTAELDLMRQYYRVEALSRYVLKFPYTLHCYLSSLVDCRTPVKKIGGCRHMTLCVIVLQFEKYIITNILTLL